MIKAKYLKQLSIKELQERLQELETNKIKLECQLRMDGHLNNRVGYGGLIGKNTSYKGGNLRDVRKDIARIKQCYILR